MAGGLLDPPVAHPRGEQVLLARERHVSDYHPLWWLLCRNSLWPVKLFQSVRCSERRRPVVLEHRVEVLAARGRCKPSRRGQPLFPLPPGLGIRVEG